MTSVQNSDSVGANMDVASVDMRKASANKLSIAELRLLIADIGMSDRVDAHTDKNELVNIVAQANCNIPTSVVPTPPTHVHTHAHTDIHTQTQAQQAQAKKKKKVDASNKKDKQRTGDIKNADIDIEKEIDIDIRAIKGGNKVGSKKKGGINNNDNINSAGTGDVTELLLNAISNLGVEMRAMREDITAIQKKEEGKSVLDAHKYICATNTPAYMDVAAVAAVDDIPVNNANTNAMSVLPKSVYMKQGKKGSVKKVSVNSKKGKVGNRVGIDILNIAGIGDGEHKLGKNNEKRKVYNYDSGIGTDIDGVSDGDSDEDSGGNESDNGVSNRRSARYTPSYLSHNRITNPDNITYTQLAQECSEAVSLHGGFYKYIHEREFRQPRNRHECESIARVLDKLIHEDGIPVDRSLGIELLIRRLVGVQQSDASGDWTWATASELNDHSTSLLSMTSLKQLFKRVHLLNQLKPTNNYVRKNTYVHKYTGTDQDGQQRTQYTSQRGGFRSQQRGGFRGSQRGGYRNNFNNRSNGRGSFSRTDQTDGGSGSTPANGNTSGRFENAK